MSSRGKTMLTHKPDRKASACVVAGLRIYTVAVTVAFVLQFPKDKYDVRKKAKRHGIFFWNYLNYLISSAGSLHASKILTVGKILQLYTDHHARWPLCKLWEHRFSVPDLVSSLPPSPVLVFINTTSNNQRLRSACDNDRRSKRFSSSAVLCLSCTCRWSKYAWSDYEW